MAIKTVLVPIDASQESMDALNSAFLVAKRFGAHITALHVLQDTAKAVSRIADLMPSNMRNEVTKYVRSDARQKADEAKAQFQGFCAEHEVAVASEPGTPGATALWVEESGEVADLLIKYGRINDLIVVSRPHKAGSEEVDFARAGRKLETLIMETGRPLLIIPPSSEGHPMRTGAKNVVVGWNGSLECSKALSLAIPWLPQMESVTLAISRHLESQVQGVLDYLSWHGVDAHVQLIDLQKDPAEALQDVCRDHEADILVVGGFTHSRTRERLFGGVTRDLLEKAQFATLMVH